MATQSTTVYIRSHLTGRHFGSCATIYSAGSKVVWSSATWPVDQRDSAIAECVAYAAEKKLIVSSVR